jgi:hypothetical protein
LAVIHVLAGWLTGLVVFLIVVVAMPVGIVLLPIALAGAPILWAVLLMSRWYARAERSRFAVMLDVRIPDPATGRPQAARWWQRLRQRLTAAETWKQLGYALIRFPLSTAQLFLVFGVWSLALAMIGLPAYNRMLPRGSAVLGGWHAPLGAAQVAALTAGGLILLLAAP